MRFREMSTFSNVVQPEFDEVFNKDFALKGNWRDTFFKNTNPIVLELGCGKGEYTVALAQIYPQVNFLGIDIKGARMWKGAKYAIENNIPNVGFLRTRVEFILSFFNRHEISEIWVTFPDPQNKKTRKKKRLVGAIFLNLYRNFLTNNGKVHLKTDDDTLFHDTCQLVKKNNLKTIYKTADLYNSGLEGDILSAKTYYEQKFLEQEKTIKYICFELPDDKIIEDICEE